MSVVPIGSESGRVGVTAKAIAHEEHAETETTEEPPVRSPTVDIETSRVHAPASEPERPLVGREEPTLDLLTDRRRRRQAVPTGVARSRVA